MTPLMRHERRRRAASGAPALVAAAALLAGATGCVSSVQRVPSEPAPVAAAAGAAAGHGLPIRGTLFIVGGGAQSREMVRQFIALAGGPQRARVAVLPMASENGAASGSEKVKELRNLGADAFLLDVTRSEADADSVVRQLSAATGVWFGGGDQVKLAAALQGSAALRAIQDRYRAGAVIGGTSAGAAVMSDSMLTGNQLWPGMAAAVDSGASYRRIARSAVEIVQGFGLLHDAIVDQHFIRRQRENRLISVVLERPSLIGVGIDEGTALVVTPSGRWSVLGASSVLVFDARNALVTPRAAGSLGATGVRLSILPAGSSFEPATGRATLPPG